MEDESNTSAMLYNLALLSERVCGSGGAKKDAIDLSICSVAEESDKGSGSKAKQMTAALQRPKSLEQMMRLLNMWVLLCHVTSVATCMTLSVSVVAASNIRFLVLIGNPNTNEENDGIGAGRLECC